MWNAGRMRSVAAHQQTVAALFAPPEVIAVDTEDALGLVVAEDVAATVSLPGFDNSAMDGYAVRVADLADAAQDTPVRLPMAADIPAGRTDELSLQPGTVHRIMTGAPLPDGADGIVPVELTDGRTDVVTFRAPAEAGKHIRRAGSDIGAGERAVPAGTRLLAPQLGLIAALGVSRVRVWRRLRVVVLSTGSELVAPGQPLRHGQIYESNSPMLTAAAVEAGADARHVHFVPDDVDGFLERIAAIADDADLIITSGGVSAGAFEVVKEALSGLAEQPGAGQVDFVKVAMQPGMPQGAGTVTAPSGRVVPIITLPGNPVSALVSFEVFIRPPLRTAMGLPAHRPRVRAQLTTGLRSPAGKRQFLRGILSDDDAAGLRVGPIGPPASHHLRYLAMSDALIDVDADVVEMHAGDIVDVITML